MVFRLVLIKKLSLMRDFPLEGHILVIKVNHTITFILFKSDHLFRLHLFKTLIITRLLILFAQICFDFKKRTIMYLVAFGWPYFAGFNIIYHIFVLYRLCKADSSFQGGTLFQLRNLINRCNVSANTTGRFNETIDSFQLVVECHIMAAAMHFFSIRNLQDAPEKKHYLL